MGRDARFGRIAGAQCLAFFVMIMESKQKKGLSVLIGENYFAHKLVVFAVSSNLIVLFWTIIRLV